MSRLNVSDETNSFYPKRIKCQGDLTISDNITPLGNRFLEAFRKELNITDKKIIAEKLGYKSDQAVYKIIKGKMEMKFDVLVKFQNYTNRSIDWLLTGNGYELAPRENLEVWDIEQYFLQYIDEDIRDAINELAYQEGIHESGWTVMNTVNKLIRLGFKTKKEETTGKGIELKINNEYFREILKEIVQNELSALTPTHPVQDFGSVDEFNVEEAVEKYDTLEQTIEAWYKFEDKELPEDFGLNFGGWEKLSMEDKIQTVKDVKNFADRMNRMIDDGEYD